MPSKVELGDRTWKGQHLFEQVLTFNDPGSVAGRLVIGASGFIGHAISFFVDEGDSQPRMLLSSSGAIAFGAGGSTSIDATLARVSTRTLQVSGNLALVSQNVTDTPHQVKGAASQSADLSTWRNSADALLKVVTATGLTRGSDGSNSEPSYSFISDPDTGMFRVGADALGFAVGGVKRLEVLTSSVRTTVPIRATEGSESSPAYSFSADTDTGMYGDTANSIHFTAGGNDKMIIGQGNIWCEVPVVAPVRRFFAGTASTNVHNGSINSVVEFNDTVNCNFTVTPDSEYDAPVGTVVNICRLGTGPVTIVPGTGVTVLTAAPALTLRAQYSECTLRKRAANEWVLSGDLG